MHAKMNGHLGRGPEKFKSAVLLMTKSVTLYVSFFLSPTQEGKGFSGCDWFFKWAVPDVSYFLFLWASFERSAIRCFFVSWAQCNSNATQSNPPKAYVYIYIIYIYINDNHKKCYGSLSLFR